MPLLAGAYVWQLRRKRRRAVRYSSVALIRAAAPRRAAWKRHVPVALLLAALAALGLAAARPRLSVDVPVSEAALILALDVSGSMCATDVEPNRLTAAQAAVRDFVQAQDGDTRIGLVLFAGFAQVAVAPTTDRAALLQAIDTLTTGRGTTIGAAILKSVDAIAEINPDVAPADPGRAIRRGRSGPGPARAAGPGQLRTGDRRAAHRRRQHPRHRAGRRGADRRPARGAGVPDRVRHAEPDVDGVHGGPARRAGLRGPRGLRRRGLGGRNYLVADEATLQQVADVTGGEYFAAADADRLQRVLADLPRTVQTQHRDVEVSVWLAGLAALLLLGSMWAAARWTAFPA